MCVHAHLILKLILEVSIASLAGSEKLSWQGLTQERRTDCVELLHVPANLHERMKT